MLYIREWWIFQSAERTFGERYKWSTWNNILNSYRVRIPSTDNYFYDKYNILYLLKIHQELTIEKVKEKKLRN